MPKLTRLRLASVGHPNARFGDLVLDFRDANGNPTDSTLWLRNGGGKSSILNLFFAGVRPNRREFLGAAAETKRELREYVQSADHSVVAYEWELDGSQGQQLFDGHAARFITGTFYEWKGSDLRRLYFACCTTAGEPRLTLNGLPLYREEEGKRVARLSFTSFKQEWQSLQKEHPSRDVVITEVQGEWRDVLERAGIDPELFRYQVLMNHREGGADELFRFDSHEEFVDFLLELVLDPSLGDTVRGNLEKHRDDLRRSNQRLRPEQELLGGLVRRLEPMKQVRSSREALRAAAVDCRQSLACLGARVRQRMAALEQSVGRFAEESERELHCADEHDARAKDQRKRAAFLRRFVAEERLVAAANEHEASQARHEQANRQSKIWEAAIPLKNAMRFERNAAEHRAALQRRRSEQQPQLDVLTAAADRYAQAMQALIDDLRGRETQMVARIGALQAESRSARAAAAKCGEVIGGQSATINHLQDLLEEDRKQRQALLGEGLLLPGESGAGAAERLRVLQAQQRESEGSLVRDLQEKRTLKDQLASQKEMAAVEAASAASRVREEEERSKVATQRRRELEADPALCCVLEVEQADLEGMTEASVGLLRQSAGSLMARVVGLRVAIQEDQRAVHHLSDGGLLPPTRDVERLLGALHGRVRAWSGWFYIAENKSNPRATVQAAPQVALGIVVADEDFDAACEIARQSNIDFEMPLVLAPERALSTNRLAQCVVLGPHSDAWFDRSAGHEELLRREVRLESAGREIADVEGQHKHVIDVDARLRDFRQTYPRGWFAEQEAELNSLRSLQAAAENRIQAIVDRIGETESQVAKLEGVLNSLRGTIDVVGRQLIRVEQYFERYECQAAARRNEVDERKLAVLAKQGEQKNLIVKAESLESKWDAQQKGIEAVRHELSQAGLLFTQIEYRTPGDVTPQPGPTQQLRDEYLRHKAQYVEKVGEEGLLQLARENDENALPHRRKYQECLGGMIQDENVQSALQTLKDPDEAERLYHDAYQATFVVLNAVKSSKNALEQATAARAEAVERCQALGMDEWQVPLTNATPLDAAKCGDLLTTWRRQMG